MLINLHNTYKQIWYDTPTYQNSNVLRPLIQSILEHPQTQKIDSTNLNNVIDNEPNDQSNYEPMPLFYTKDGKLITE